jgi:hypothetical protein
MQDMKALCDQVRQIACLQSARLEDGLLINFGSYKFEIRKFAWSEHQRQGAPTARSLLSSAIFALSAFFAVKS